MTFGILYMKKQTEQFLEENFRGNKNKNYSDKALDKIRLGYDSWDRCCRVLGQLSFPTTCVQYLFVYSLWRDSFFIGISLFIIASLLFCVTHRFFLTFPLNSENIFIFLFCMQASSFAKGKPQKIINSCRRHTFLCLSQCRT